MPVHTTAIIDPRAEIDPSAEIGPYVVVDGPVRVGRRTRVIAGAYLAGETEIGANRGTQAGTWTEIGDDNYLMSHAHVGHNCRLGSHVVLATGATLGGHVVVEDRAFISGNCVVHQFCRVGQLAIMRGLSRASRDVPPFAISDGTHTVRGLNRVGLRRAGFDRERIRALATAFRILFRVRTNLGAALTRVEAEVRSPDVDHLLAFIRASRRGVTHGPQRGATAEAVEDDGEP